MSSFKFSWDAVFSRVKSKDRLFLIRQLAIMISSGVPLAQALVLALQQTNNEVIRQALRVMIQDIEMGQPLSVAAGRFPHIFDHVTIAIIRSGEASGQLQNVLVELADRLEVSYNFTLKVRNALLYPLFVIFVTIIVGIITTTVIIPKLTTIFEETDVPLPLTTTIVIAISTFIINYWFLLILATILAGLGLKSYLSTSAGQEAFYNLEMKVPILRDLLLNSYLVRFTTVLELLIRAGVPITEALVIVADSMSNRIWVQSLQIVQREVERGIPLSVALSRHGIFPKQLTQMVAVGEQTGKLDGVLNTMSRYYEEQTSALIKSVTSLIEPVLLIMVAVVVGFVVLSVIFPIYNLAEQI